MATKIRKNRDPYKLKSQSLKDLLFPYEVWVEGYNTGFSDAIEYMKERVDELLHFCKNNELQRSNLVYLRKVIVKEM